MPCADALILATAKRRAAVPSIPASASQPISRTSATRSGKLPMCAGSPPSWRSVARKRWAYGHCDRSSEDIERVPDRLVESGYRPVSSGGTRSIRMNLHSSVMAHAASGTAAWAMKMRVYAGTWSCRLAADSAGEVN